MATRNNGDPAQRTNNVGDPHGVSELADTYHFITACHQDAVASRR